ncbi:MAG TPA: hypothetical protein VNT99_16095 [Methylomirabilota bacterium]|nr:hypothetical protein [Methylomirabilota bacterium]
MKATILFCAALLLAGCARYDGGRSGAPPNQRGLQGASEYDDAFPYRSGPGLPSTDRQVPTRRGPNEPSEAK